MATPPAGIDTDEFDTYCDHLIVRDLDSLRVVGTYRILAPHRARELGRLYSEGEFDLSRLTHIRPSMVEVGRSCVHQVMSAILRDPPAPLPARVPPLPEPAAEEVRRILERCLAKDREQRYQSVRDAILDLEAARRRLEPRDPRPPHREAGRRRLRAAAVLTAGGLAVAAVVGWSLISRRPALAFAQRDWLLVADVTNDTGEQVFDVALKVALETDLRQSRYANVVDQAQVQNAARLQRLPPAAKLDLDAARRVCQVAGVRALVLPHRSSLEGPDWKWLRPNFPMGTVLNSPKMISS